MAALKVWTGGTKQAGILIWDNAEMNLLKALVICGPGISSGKQEYRSGLQAPNHELGKRVEQSV